MRRSLKTAVVQSAVFIVCTVAAFSILVRTDVVRRLAYLVEKGRIEALRESLPDGDTLAQLDLEARTVAALVTPAVVQIRTQKRISLDDLLILSDEADTDPAESDAGSHGIEEAQREREALADLFRRHEGIQIQDGYGSGFIVDAENGFIVTNDHVIAGADSIQVCLADGRIFGAELLGADPKSDLAVIRVKASDLHELVLADSDEVEVGDSVMSVGNPFGLDGSVSRGIISAKGRSNIDIHGTEYRGFLQTDAVINPGNSGGPLVNLRGEVVAINTAIATTSGHYDGVGFAIPARRIKQALPALVRGEQVPRGFLGVSIVNATTNGAAEPFAPEGRIRGVLVREVLAGSPADRYGVRVGDVILAIDGRTVRHSADLIDRVGDATPGTTLVLDIERVGVRQPLAIVIGRQPADFSTQQRRTD